MQRPRPRPSPRQQPRPAPSRGLKPSAPVPCHPPTFGVSVGLYARTPIPTDTHFRFVTTPPPRQSSGWVIRHFKKVTGFGVGCLS